MKQCCSSQTAIISLLLLLAQSVDTAALVVSAPGIRIDTFVDTAPREPVETVAPPLSLRLRSTTEGDLKDIASLLASATARTDESQWNWKTTMEVLRSKSALHNLLSSRYEAMKEGVRAAKLVPLDDSSNNVDHMRLIWDNDSFRTRLEKAATLAKEPHVWKEQSFDAFPQDFNSLRHAMITAEDRATGRIIGFCEIAMLKLPSCYQTERTPVVYAPTIVNLATSSKHRRQGVASALLKSAKRYVHRKWSYGEIALYVKSSNRGAVALYSKHGFKSFGESENGELYMTKSLRSQMEKLLACRHHYKTTDP